MPYASTVSLGELPALSAARMSVSRETAPPREKTLPTSEARSRASAFEETFREEFERRYQPLARYLARLTGNSATAADLAQEAFVRLLRRGSMPDDTRAWLVSVAHNLLRNERQQSKRRAEILAERRLEVVCGDESTVADPTEAAERQAWVRSALDALPERERQMLLLRYDGFSYREIAQALSLHEASVGTLLARAKAAFRAALGESRGCI